MSDSRCLLQNGCLLGVQRRGGVCAVDLIFTMEVPCSSVPLSVLRPLSFLLCTFSTLWCYGLTSWTEVFLQMKLHGERSPLYKINVKTERKWEGASESTVALRVCPGFPWNHSSGHKPLSSPPWTYSIFSPLFAFPLSATLTWDGILPVLQDPRGHLFLNLSLIPFSWTHSLRNP